MLDVMSESTSTPEPATTPVATTTPPEPAYVEREPRRSRLTAVAAWVGIVAGVVFIVAVVFFSGFILGSHSGGHRGGHHGGGDRDFAMLAAAVRADVPDGADGPGARFERPPSDPAAQVGPADPPKSGLSPRSRPRRRRRARNTQPGVRLCAREQRFAYEAAHSALSVVVFWVFADCGPAHCGRQTTVRRRVDG